MAICKGQHLLRHSSTLQVPISLSSAEAEYYSVTKGGANVLGTQAYLQDWKLPVEAKILYSDSSSAKAFASRRGLGKQRHVQTRFLWLQDRVAAGHLQVRTLKGTENPSDLLTKAMSLAYCGKIGCEFR